MEHKGDHLITDSKPETIRKSVEGSLERLQIDCIDLYCQHRIDSEVEAEVVAGVMEDLIEECLIKSWGISEANEEYLRRAHDVCPVTAIQNRYSMLARGHENIFKTCEELGITFVAFSPMANGFLTGAYTKDSKFEESDFRSFMPQYTKEGFESAKELINLMDNISQKKDATMAQISLAWMMCKKDFIISIPGTTKINNLKDNFGACNINLTKNEIKEIDLLLSNMDVPVFGGHSSS